MDKVELEVDSTTELMVCESCGTTHQEFKKGGRWVVKHVIMFFALCLIHCLMVCMPVQSILGKVPAGSESRIQFEQSH
jgi:protein-arginine kinase activator protein McsA